jgi:hypothetical protein
MKFFLILHILLPVRIKVGNVPSTRNSRGSASKSHCVKGRKLISIRTCRAFTWFGWNLCKIQRDVCDLRVIRGSRDGAWPWYVHWWFSEACDTQTAQSSWISLWIASCSTPLAVLTEVDCIYCAVRTDVLNVILVVTGVPWLRRFVAGLSPQRPRFDPRTVHVWYVVYTGSGFSPSTSVFSCQYHSTSTPYLSLSTFCS